jgi:hypothetical protein
MKKIIGVIGNPQLDVTLLNRIENVVVNNLEVKNTMREDYLQFPKEYIESFNKYKSVIDTNIDTKIYDKSKSKYHK